MFKAFPLLLLVVLVYNVVVFGAPALLDVQPEQTVEEATGAIGDDSEAAEPPPPPPPPKEGPVFSTDQLMDSAFFSVTMPSRAVWRLTYGDLFIVVGLLLLFVELIRSTSTGGTVITNHALSLLVLVICLVEFLILKGFATSTFFFLLLMACIDVVAGFIISIRGARRDLSLGGGG